VALYRGVYLIDADMYADGLPQQTWWKAALLAHGPGFCLVAGSGGRAFRMHGLPLVEANIELAQVGTNPRSRRTGNSPAPAHPDAPGIVVRQFVVAPHEIVMVDGLPVRRADLTAVDAALALNRPRMLSVLDSCLHLELATREDLLVAVELAKGRPGVSQLRPLAELADGRAESMVESFVRLACIDGNVPPDDLQYKVWSANHRQLIAVGDLGWDKNRPRPLLAEADGESVHSLPKPVYRDRTRGNALTTRACDTLRFTFADANRPTYIAATVRAALGAA
jgi:hypothetical protein